MKFWQVCIVAESACYLRHVHPSVRTSVTATGGISVKNDVRDLCTEWHKKRELLKNPTKIEEIQEKKFIDRNWTITICFLRDSNPNYQCLKITSCRWLPPPRMHSFTDGVAFCRACNTHTEWHKRTGTFEMRSGSERMHTWRRTPSTGRNFQTLIIWITVS